MRENLSDPQFMDKEALSEIMSLLGPQDKNDLSFVTSTSTLRELQHLQPTNKKINFDLEFLGTPKHLRTVISYCLQFNPYFRARAVDLLNLSGFKELRKGPLPVVTPADQLEEDEYPSSPIGILD